MSVLMTYSTMAFGVIDLRVEDNDYYTQSATQLLSRTFMLSFTFEGQSIGLHK